MVPFCYGAMVGREIYSYWLLSALAYRSRWHRTENPAGLYSSTLTGIVEIAREHLDRHGDTPIADDHFAQRYVYCDNLIVLCRIGEKIFTITICLAASTILPPRSCCLGGGVPGLDQSGHRSPAGQNRPG